VCYIAAHTAVIFDCHTRAQLVLQGHRNPISSLVATEDRSLVVTADEGPDSSMIVVWDVTTGEPVRTIENPHATGVVAMDITPDGAYAVTVAGVDAFASADEAQEMCVWRLDDDDAFDDGNGDGALDRSASEDRPAPVLLGYAPDGDAQTCVRFHPYDWTEFATNGRRRVFFWSRDDEGSETLRRYSPPASARDFKQSIGDFTRSVFVAVPGEGAGRGMCVTGTRDGDVVVWDSGGVPPGGLARFAASGMRPGDRRAIKILRVHHAAVTHLGVVRGSVAGVGPTHLVTGGDDGNVRFFDRKLRLTAWFDGLDAGGVTSVSFTRPRGLGRERFGGFDEDAGRDGEEMLMGDFDAPDFVVGTDRSNIVALRAATFEDAGAAEAIRTAETLVEGTHDAVIAADAHPNEPVLCCVGSGGFVWTWDYDAKRVVAARDASRRGAVPPPSAARYRSDGEGLIVGTHGGHLKALDPRTLAEVQSMRFTNHAVTRVVASDDAACSYAAVADEGGCVGVFRLRGPVREPPEGTDPSRAFEFIGKHRAHEEVRGLALRATDDGRVELVSCGAEGRLVRYDVAGSTAEEGVKTLATSDVALGGLAAGGDASPTALAFAPGSKRPTLLVADDACRVRTVDCETLTAISVTLAPAYGGPLARIQPFGDDTVGWRLAYATADAVAGVATYPLDGDPDRAVGLIAHPGAINAEATCVGHDGRAMFTVGGGDRSDAGRVINCWTVDPEAYLPGGVEDAAALAAPARERFARLVEGGAEGETMTDARRLFVYAQLRAQGEDSTANRAAGLDGRVPLEHLPALMRALGHYPSERELNDAMTELKVEAENRGESPPTEIDFDRLVALFANRGPAEIPGLETVQAAFEALGAGGDSAIDRASLVRALTTSGEAMTREELDAAAEALLGPGAVAEDLIPEAVTARDFAEETLGFRMDLGADKNTTTTVGDERAEMEPVAA